MITATQRGTTLVVPLFYINPISQTKKARSAVQTPTATKRSLYNLIKAQTLLPLPLQKETHFTAYRPGAAYWLRWDCENAEYEAYFSAVAGRPLLAIKKWSYDATDMRVASPTTLYQPTLAQLEQLRMVRKPK